MKFVPPAVILLTAIVGAQPIKSEDQRAVVDSRSYVWTTYILGEQVQYGIPDTDDRGLWIACDGKGILEIGGPTSGGMEEGAKVKVTFSIAGKTDSETVTGSATERGDGMNFVVPVSPKSIAISSLVSGRAVQIATAGTQWIVPGEGAPKEIKPLLLACDTKKTAR